MNIQTKGYRIINAEIELVSCREDSLTRYDGRRLDQLVLLPMVISSHDDFDRLIEFLHITKHCFDRPKKSNK